MKFFNLLGLSPRRRILARAKKIADDVELLKDKYRSMSDEQLSNMTNVFLEELKKGKSLDDILVDAFAVAREAIYRVHGLFAFHVQIIGASIVHFGDFTEMYTGEGKTLTIIIVAYLNALSKKGVHVVTVNEYLVQRDAKFCAKALNPLNITVGYNIAKFDANQKRNMFACDITYTTNSELGFDYLRDNMVKRYEDKVIRELNFAIIDEADSVLIDEARTPLIISGQPKKDISMYIEVDSFVKSLNSNDYKKDPESNSITLTEQGIKKAQAHYKIDNIFNFEHSILIHKIKNALMANYVFENGVEYIVKDNEILLIDHFTGRILQGRSYNAGLHQAIQAKERVKIEPENITIATITYQSFFRLYKKLSGVSGTALTEAEEFLRVYNMIVVPVPTNKKVIRKDMPDYIFANKVSKWKHVVAEIERVHQTGQPILVGTSSVDDSEILSKYLRNKGIKFELLNAKNLAREAEIIAGAGQKYAVTISTNMAGRGTDIKLGPGVAELGGLYVIGTERHESRRVDNQLKGRSGRQGDPGMTRFFISLQDTIFERFGADKQDKANDKIDDDYFDNWFFNRLVLSCQKKVENLNFDYRKNLIDYDSVLSAQRELIYKQRDQILKNKNNLSIIYLMAERVAKDLSTLFRLEKNPSYVDAEKLTIALNTKLLNSNIISPEIFKDKTIDEAKELIEKILKLSIQTRIEALGIEQASNIIREIAIQNLDMQWTIHLDLINRIREGAPLRSLEQRSPLNIFIEDSDRHFENLKRNVAHQTVIAFHRFFIPNVREKIFNALANVLPEIESLRSSNRDVNQSSEIIDNAFDKVLTFEPPKANDPRIANVVKSPVVADQNDDAKAKLLEKIKSAKK